ncbi:hypothetical protein [Nocardia camponoti]|uniref:Uncharacterized protein n=1 Tax=Nocardia camponoti TaxID=1616106 RepID=A0A917QMK3_9NOCA|nr:hypothetical protein [Nocardia camponoti]GGK58665.1 hypothetical protein GCM10011591_33600 [Nocardia camponoti]
MPDDGIGKVARDLYGLDPAEFVAARARHAAAAKAAGDAGLAKAINALRKPTVAAWTVNLLARSASTEIAALLDLGAALRTAQQQFSGAELRALSSQRQQVINALTKQAGSLAAEHGKPATEQTLREVGQTLTAALADPAVARLVESGTLPTTVSYDGFGPVGLVALDGGLSGKTESTRSRSRGGGSDGKSRRDADRPARAPKESQHGVGQGESSTEPGSPRGLGSVSAQDRATRGETAVQDRAAEAKQAGRARGEVADADADADELAPTEARAAKPDELARGEVAAAKLARAEAAAAKRDELARAEAQQELDDAEDALTAAATDRDNAEAAAEQARADLDAADARITELREELAKAEHERTAANAADHRARNELSSARSQFDRVQRWVERARARAGKPSA